MRRFLPLFALIPVGLVVSGCQTVTDDVYSSDTSVSLESSKFRVKTESTGVQESTGTAEREYLFWFIPISGPSSFAATDSDGLLFKDPLKQAALLDACEKSDADILLEPIYEENTDRGPFAFWRKRSVSVKGTPAKVTGVEEIPLKQWGQICGDSSGTRIGPGRDWVVSTAGFDGLTSNDDIEVGRKKFSINGAGNGDGFVAHVEWLSPIGNSRFDFSIRGFYSSVDSEVEKRGSYTETYYTYRRRWYRSQWGWGSPTIWDSYLYPTAHTRRRYYYYTETLEQENVAGECCVFWNPFRGKLFAPFAGVGVRLERMDGEDNDNDLNLSPVGRVGLDVNLGKWDVRCEGLFGDKSKEMIGSVGYDITSDIQLNAFADRLDVDLKDSVMFGVGLSFYL